MNRGFAGIFEWGGFPRRGSIIAATAMTTTFLTAVEYKDAYHVKYGWSWADIVANSSGQVTALALMLVPPLDRAISVKIMYQPSGDFFHALSTEGPLNTPEDYSGQTYLVAYHFASLPVVNREKSLRALRYVDFSIGYGTRGYKPVPEPPIPVRQDLSFGFSVNFQAVFDDLLWPKHGTPSTGTQVVHFINEVYQIPYTRIPILSLQRTGPATRKDATERRASASARPNVRGCWADEEQLVRLDASGDESAAQAAAAVTGVRAIHEPAVFVRELGDELTRSVYAILKVRDVNFENGRCRVLVHVFERRKQVGDAMRAIETEQHRQPAAALHFFDEQKGTRAESTRRKGLVEAPREVGGERFEGPALPLEWTRFACEQMARSHPQQRHAA